MALFGFSAILTRLVAQPATTVAFARVLVSSACLLAYLCARAARAACAARPARAGSAARSARAARGWRAGFAASLARHLPRSRADALLLLAAGGVLAFHWAAFAYSVQVASVAVGTVAFSAFPAFAAVLEPVVYKERMSARAAVCSAVMLAGALLLAPWGGPAAGGGAGGAWLGLSVGLAAALAYAALALLNRRFAARYDPAAVSFYEQSAAALLLAPAVIARPPALSPRDALLLLALGAACTALAHSLFVHGLARVKVSTAGVVSCLEPVYAVALAAALLREAPSPREAAGCLVVAAAAAYMTARAQPAAPC